MSDRNGEGPVPRVAQPYTLPAGEVVAALGSDGATGLAPAEADRRLRAVGSNSLREASRPSLLQLFLEQLDDFLIRLLIVAAVIAAVVSYVEGESYIDSLAIIAIVVLNSVIGVAQARRAENALRALKEMAAPDATVVRGGTHRTVPSRDVVPGDIVALETGNYVPADLRLLAAVNLRIEEAALTGESLAVRKDADALCAADTLRGDQRNMAFGGTVVTYGRGRGVVTATGMATAIGEIAEMIQSYEREPTPLQQSLDRLGRTLGRITLVVCAIVFAVGLVRGTDLAMLLSEPLAYVRTYGEELIDLFMIAVSLAIAAVPEGLPAVVTVALSVGMQRMVRRNALVRRLPAVETLGSATVICSDKTGTLTQNEMMVVQAELDGATLKIVGEGYAPEAVWYAGGAAFEPAQSDDLQLLAGAAVLASDALVEHDGSRWRVVGDPTEGALVVLAARAGLDRGWLAESAPRIAEVPFDSARKRMTTVHRVVAQDVLPGSGVEPGGWIALVKGAPDLVLELCTRYASDGRTEPLDAATRERIVTAHDSMTAQALRVLAVAFRPLDGPPESATADDLERDLVFVGLLGMIDPPRPEVASAVERARDAGIRTIMITGDHQDTAVAIGRGLALLRPDKRVVNGAGLNELDDDELRAAMPDVDVFARVSPEHKVRIVDALKTDGHVVAMTGDGVNDAPALKRAHIGVAMGLSGTDVSRETADMVLTDDNYASIVAAIEEGRTIYTNIRKFVFYLLSCNIGEILIIFTAMLLALAPEPPLLPIQLLWLNLVTDGLPALALGMEPAEPDVMERPPRDPQSGILTRDLWTSIGVQAVVDAAATLAAFVWAYDGPETLAYAQTVAFATLVTAELLRAFTARSQVLSIFQQGVFSNRWMIVATLSSFALLLAAIYVAPLASAFRTVPLAADTWLTVLAFAVLPATAAELLKLLRRHASRTTALAAT